jgi:hypothetical protein
MDDFSVLCINCQVMIPSQQAEDHSRDCFVVSTQVKQVEESSSAEQVRFKLLRMNEFLESQSTAGLSPSEADYLKNYRRICTELLTPTIPAVNEVYESLQSLLLNFAGSHAILLYGERLKALCTEQLLISHGHPVITQLSKLPPRKPLCIDTLNSELGSQADFMSSLPSDRASVVSMNFDVCAESDNMRYFYSQCLTVKLKHDSHSLVQRASIPKLFRYALSINVPIANWPEFIQHELSHPDKWVHSSRKAPRQGARH